MALQVWLPLNKDGAVKNQGLANVNITSTAVYSTSGKLGGSYYFSGSSNRVSFPSQPWMAPNDTNSISIAMWVKAGSFDYIIAANAFEFRLLSSLFQWRLGNGGTNTFIVQTSGITFTTGTWYHLCGTWDAKNKKLAAYINGELVKELTSTLTSYNNISSTINLVYGGSWNINDFRFYDHCLSPKEVKEISKGLVLHYPLNDAYVEGTTNIASNLSPSQIGGWQKMTITKLSTNNYHLKHQTSDSTNLSYWSTFVYTLPSEYSNKTISFSARIKNIVYNDIKDSSWLYIGPGNDGQYPTHGSATFYCYELKENQLISWTGVLSNSNRYVLVELWNDANSTSGSIEFDLVDIQIEEKDHVTPYTLNTRNETTVYDCSGYQNDGTASESLPYALNSPRYKGCYYFNATSKRITLPTINMTEFANTFSISWWGNAPSYSNGIMYWGFSNGNHLNYYSGRYCNTNDGSSNPYYAPNTTTTITVPSANEWHHFVMVGDGSTNKLYMDGALYGVAKTYKGITGNTIVINGYDSSVNYKTNGYISDFRIYSTALSADDIKELYNTSCIINS